MTDQAHPKKQPVFSAIIWTNPKSPVSSQKTFTKKIGWQTDIKKDIETKRKHGYTSKHTGRTDEQANWQRLVHRIPVLCTDLKKTPDGTYSLSFFQ